MNIKLFVSMPCYKKHIDSDCVVPIYQYPELVDDVDGINAYSVNNPLDSVFYQELASLYYVWKNEKCDWYGFCTHDVYPSFIKHTCDAYKNNIVESISECNSEYLGLDMLSTFITPDVNIVIPEFWDLKDTGVLNVHDAYADTFALHVEDLDMAISILKKKYPDYALDADEYINGTFNNVYSVFFMDSLTFDEYCTWLFDILFTFSEKKNYYNYDLYEKKVLIELSARFLGIFVLHQRNSGKTIKTIGRVIFNDTSFGRTKIFATHHNKFIKIQNPVLENISSCGQYSDDVMRSNGDGMNIAERANTFCELVTQYWAWKNENLDYYGFCHYRRFISFGKWVDSDDYGNVFLDKYDPYLTNLIGYNVDIEPEIHRYDIILTEPWDLKKCGIKSIYEQYSEAEHLYVKDLDLAVSVLKKLYPEYSDAADLYLSGTDFYPCNMFVMKKKYFTEYSEWLFNILFEVEKQIDIRNYSVESTRTIGHIAERLLGIFVKYKVDHEKIKLRVVQRVCVSDMSYDQLYLPFANHDNIPVIFATNDNFSLYTAATINSIISVSKCNKYYDIYILYSNLSEENKNIIRDISKNNSNFKTRFVNVNKYLEKYNLKPNYHITVETFYRLLAPEIFKNYNKMIYLDGDLLVKRDLSELYDINIGNDLIAGVLDSDFIGQYCGGRKDIKQYADEVLKLKDPYGYCQAGVLVLNLSEMRSTFTPYELLDVGDNVLYIYGDQDILNMKCQGRIHYIDMSWNVMHACDNGRIKVIKGYAPKRIADAYFKSRESPYIIHYAGYLKPWNSPAVDFGDLYWESLKNTVLYELILEKHLSAIGSKQTEPTIKQSLRYLVSAFLKKIRR